MQIKKLIGDKVYLSPRNPDDYEIFTKWMNDLEVTKGLTSSHRIFTFTDEKKYLSMDSNQSESHFMIVDNESDKTIGSTALMDIDYINRTATLGVFIGDKDFWGKGYGSDAINLILDFGFNIHNLNNIKLHVYDYNERAIKCYEKLGFKVVGRLRESKIVCNKKYDDIIMDMLSSEFESNYIKKIYND